MDFGIAKTLDPTSSEYTQTGTGMQMGTPMYMSPEQVKSSKDVGPASDIYSLGVVLWQMVTGKRPYDTNTLSTFELQLKIVQERLSSTDSHWDEAIQIATDKETAKRYATCEKFIASMGKETIQVSVHEDATVLIAGPQNDSRNPFTPFVKSEVDKDILELLGPFIKVAGGSFQMGSPSTDPLGRHDELLHAVSISDFHIQATTVSQALYERITGENPSDDKTWKDLPVTNVSWHDANAFIEKLSALTNRGYRLPTEAEWEYAARGGSLSKGYLYSGSNNPDDIGWHAGNSQKRLHVCREKQPNELGIYDMTGNVWEWCGDRYGPYRIDAFSQQNPKGPDNGEYRVLRGGSWCNFAQFCRSADRGRNDPRNRNINLGFRLVFSPSSP